MKDYLINWLNTLGIVLTPLQMSLTLLAFILIISVVIHLSFHQVVIKLIKKLTRQSRQTWRKILFEKKLFSRLAFIVQGIILYMQVSLWLNPKGIFYSSLQTFSLLWITLFITLSLFSLVDVFAYLTRKNKRTRNLPIQGLLQAVKLFITLVAFIIMIAVLIDRSPLLIISGLGAMTAVLLLVFKDPIMGLVAGIQLSANNLLRLGDWLEMPSYGADGDVIEIGLTTVKVQNWDKTITTIPTYALISDSFKNWQGMSESGGRRIMRSIYIDANSVKFMDQELYDILYDACLLTPYLTEKKSEIDSYNQSNPANMDMKVNGRRLTNLGTLRAYLTNYLKHHPNINQQMTLMVRQLAAENSGIPLQIYAFSNTTVWSEYENIQANIFDHIYAIIDAFDLRIHQSPGSADFQLLGESLKVNKEPSVMTQEKTIKPNNS
jgi:miniconductance mechanosensitive channel